MKCSIKREIKDGIKAFEDIKALIRALLFLILDFFIRLWVPISLFCSLIRLSRGLI